MNMLFKQLNKRFATLAIAEHNGKILSKNTLKLLTASSKLNDQTHLLVCGKHDQELINNIKKYAGKNITSVIRAKTNNIIGQQVTSIIKNIIGKGGYKNVVGLSTSIGKDIIPRVAGYFTSQPISDIIQITSQNTYVRPTYAGNALTRVQTTQNLNFLTFRPSSFDQAPEAEGNFSVNEAQIPSSRTSFVGEKTSDSSKPQLTTAKIVVSGGRGVKSKENFSIINDLADAFGDAAVGASRAAVDAGYCPNQLQVGQTGKVVAPELYVAVGLSGAVQHLAGMKDSKVIVAINTKPDQPIFQIANYGLQADLFKAVPQLIEKLKKIKGK